MWQVSQLAAGYIFWICNNVLVYVRVAIVTDLPISVNFHFSRVLLDRKNMELQHGLLLKGMHLHVVR